MSRNFEPAFLVNLGGAHLPPVQLPVSARYQVCVDAGAAAAVAFFDDFHLVGLHDHMACSVSDFTQVARTSLSKCGDTSAERLRGCIDAFAAGYLGRMHQEFGRVFGGRADDSEASTNAPRCHRSSKIH